MTSPLQLAILFSAAYFLGSVPWGVIVARAHGVDIRKHGSGNIGATNVGRVIGRKWGTLVFLLDAGKGAAATVGTGLYLVYLTTGGQGISPVARDVIWLASGLTCVVGHLFPIFARFSGGKGVATSLGVILGVYPYLTLPGLLALGVWVMVVRFTGYVSLGSLCAAAFLPVAFMAMVYYAAWPLAEHYPLLCLLVVLAVLVFVRHRDNIRRLLAGTENRIGRHNRSGTTPE